MFPDLFSVQGKTALVTGGSRGIGYMIAEGLLRAGARVYISSRKADACAAAEKELSQYGQVKAIPADVSSEEQCRALIEEISALESGRLHILVNNAGATWGAAFDDFPDKAWDRVLGLNVKAPFNLTRLARPLLEAASAPDDPARVINIGSIDGMVVPGFGNFSYSASKAAIHHLTRHLAAELSPAILVNAIAPGPFPSKMMEGPLKELGDQLVEASPVGRIGRTEDVAAAAVYLSSRATNYMTGAVIPLDGGLSTTLGINLGGE
ncbi:SDR family oxidoreductase [Streptomyces sp. 3214.6]|uniref:SDR family oxidoreductase n=1 Tax=Streptomyces sp. 3214.6 TaxID=1882757 RepID=UPI00090AD36C|nr:SDR family oxidoreductase [Streptomyces sp. 3214.6]SHH31304.1 NAD(P)-dependent dehydrogenase, short-chain alcohol dehydrogenase family [Streptomyces sp. 3214.6]